MENYSSESRISEKSAGVIYEELDRDQFIPYLVEITENSWHVHHKGGVFPIDKNKFTFVVEDEVQRFDKFYHNPWHARRRWEVASLF